MMFFEVWKFIKIPAPFPLNIITDSDIVVDFFKCIGSVIKQVLNIFNLLGLLKLIFQ